MSLVVEEAAKGGQLHVLEWLWENCRTRCAWGWLELFRAMDNKHFKVSKWLRTRISPQSDGAQDAIESAGGNGDVDTVRWLHDNFTVDMSEVVRSSTYQPDVMLWSLENCLSELSDKGITHLGEFGAKEGKLDSLKQLAPRIYTTRLGDLFCEAAEYGHVNIVKWFVEEKGVTDVRYAFHQAADNGHVNVLKYFHAKNMWNSKWADLNYAAGIGSLETVQWLHETVNAGCSKSAMDMAAFHGHLETVKWLHANRTEGCSVRAMHLAAVHGHINPPTTTRCI